MITNLPEWKVSKTNLSIFNWKTILEIEKMFSLKETTQKSNSFCKD